jgi:hypothetical protein
VIDDCGALVSHQFATSREFESGTSHFRIMMCAEFMMVDNAWSEGKIIVAREN